MTFFELSGAKIDFFVFKQNFTMKIDQNRPKNDANQILGRE